jgi:hypothetical protein
MGTEAKVYLTHIKPLAEHLFQRSNLFGFKGIMGMIALQASHTLPTVAFPSSPFSPMPKSDHVVITNTPVNRMTG